MYAPMFYSYDKSSSLGLFTAWLAASARKGKRQELTAKALTRRSCFSLELVGTKAIMVTAKYSPSKRKYIQLPSFFFGISVVIWEGLYIRKRITTFSLDYPQLLYWQARYRLAFSPRYRDQEFPGVTGIGKEPFVCFLFRGLFIVTSEVSFLIFS